jgi:hypothetical protein
MSSEISSNTAFFSRVQKNLESPLLLQILPESSSIWAFLALLYRGEVAVAVLQVPAWLAPMTDKQSLLPPRPGIIN